MIYAFAKRSGGIPSIKEIMYVVKRNFGGLQDLETWGIFAKELSSVMEKEVPYFRQTVILRINVFHWLTSHMVVQK